MLYIFNVYCLTLFEKSYPDNSYENLEIKFSEYVHEKFKSYNLEEYNTTIEKYIDMYNLRKLSIIFFIFEKIQTQIFMILENLCLNSLTLYFDNLFDIYNKLYSQRLEQEKNSTKKYK